MLTDPIADMLTRIRNAVQIKAEKVDIPILGVGGVSYGKDAIKMIKAGASLVGIGSGIYFRGIDIFRKICDEMKDA